MKKTTFLKVSLLAFMLIQSFLSFSQNLTSFAKRYDQDIKGDMLLIGNSILNRKSSTRNPNDPYNGANLNSDFNMEYINIDNGATPGVFNSSSANLVVPNPVATSAPCYKIVYAALYWGAVSKGTTPVTNIKFKMPTGGYNDVAGTVIYNSNTPIGTSLPYACFADVTSLVTGTGNPNPEGTYTVANLSTAQGTNGGTGLSAGWSLYIVYEDPKLPAKSITSFDGFSAISSTVNLDIPVSGFRTIPTGPVRAKFAFSALEGDQGINGDYLAVNGSILSAVNNAGTTIRGTNNFFNSSVTYIDPTTSKTENYLNRTPNGTNTLGYDAGILEINNNGNAIIKNNDINATINLRSTQDVYFYYFNAIALDIIAPNIVLTKQVFDNASPPNDIGNQNVTLGQELFYVIGFQNIGNDNAENFTIEDILPININFDPNNIIVPNGSGITYAYNAASRTIVFTVPKNLVEVNDPRYVIRFKVRVVPECNDLSDACSDKIQNTAYATYNGVTSGIKVDDQQSLATFGACFLGTPAPTNFLVGLENCIYTKDYQLCGTSVVLTAANGYDAYSWSTSSSGTPVIGTTQSITVTQTGTYYVTNFAKAPCRSIKQVVTVSPAGSAVTNPVIPFATQTVTCPNNGKDFPKIFLCGANASKLITTGVSDAISIQWQRLNEASCPAIGTDDCANENVSCTWNTVVTGPNYTADTSGQYRVVFNYAGGCFNVFYFNVFKNLLNPTAVSRDIICNTSGQITVGGVPATGYEFSLNPTGPFQNSNVFPISNPGTYTVYIRQQGVVSNPCLFSVPDIDIRRRNFTISEFVTQPLCNGDRGLIKLAANDVRPQYFYTLRKNGTIVNSVGPIAANDFDFPNLTAGTYTYEVRTDDECLGTGSINIIEPAILTATVAQTKSLTCESGEITVTPVGGTSPFSYYVNGATSPQFSNVINTPTAGLYEILVIDFNGCRTTTSITVASVPKPVYNTVGTNVNCYNDTTGVINFNMTNSNGYTVTYSIDNGLTYGSSAVISNLAAGTYNTILKYSLNGVECLDTMRPITITQPSAAVTASAGVSELAGCGPNGEGRVRITNPQGGVAPYEFSFDNQATWTTVNNALKLPGSYILYVRDRNNCIFQAPVTVDPAPAAPNINVDTPVDFNCDGTATSTVTVNNPGNVNYTYDYFIDNVRNTNIPGNVFLNVAPGTHTIRVDYKLNSVSTFSNLLFEDFGKGGYTTTPGINPAYCFEDETTPHPPGFPCGNFNDYQINDGKYAVASSIKTTFGVWIVAKDHTLPTDPLGRFLCVNVGGSAGVGGVLYSKAITNIIPNQDVRVSIWAENLIKKTSPALGDPDLTIQLWKDYGLPTAVQVGASVNTGSIPKSEKWENYVLSINPGNNTDLTFLVRSNSTVINGNDVLIDDINVFQLPVACITSRSFTIEVPTGKAFNAQISGIKNVTCFGSSNGEITIAAQNFDVATGFQYSKDNGANWLTTTTSPVTITGLAAATYAVLVRPNPSSAASCTKTFSQLITAPTQVTASASIILQATCSTGATIRAVGGGGTPAYQYELRQANGITVVTAFNNNSDFTNVSVGSYTVFVRDANACTNATGVAVTVNAPPSLTATLNASTDYCYTVADPATLVVNVSGGVGPFTYKLDSNASISSALTTFSFANVTPGTHTVLVTDSNNCTSTISSIVIEPALTFNVSLLQDLTCLVNASIGNPLITGGNGTPYTYTVSRNSGAPTVVTSFPYTATLAGNYVFTVTDSRGCPATSNTITVTAKTTPTHTTAKTDITCNGFNNGTITVTASGGFTSAYTYILTGPIPTVTQSTNQFTNLPAGIYNIKVIDSKGCESTVTNVTISNPAVITASIAATDIKCSTSGTVPAVVTVTASGGTGTLQYSFNGTTAFTTANTFSTTTAGPVTAYVKDVNGCQIGPLSITIDSIDQITDITITDSGYDCSTTPPGGNINIAAVKTNVSAPIRYQIISGPAGFSTATNSSGTFQGLAPGNYVFQAQDIKTDCFFRKAYTVSGAPDIVAGGSVLTPILCFGGTGTIQFTVSGVKDRGYNYTITNAANVSIQNANNVSETITTINVPTAQPAGVYTITVTDRKTLCTDDYSVTLTQPTALTISSATPTTVNCNNDTAQITVIATGGTTNYSYAFASSPSTVPTSTYASSNVLTVDTNLATQMSWDVYVKDANGCTQKSTVAISSDPTPTVTATLTGQCTSTTGSFTITATGSNGTGTLTYGINGTTGAFQSSPVFTVVPRATPYTVWVKDANGCTSSATPITVYPQLTASAAVTKTLDCTSTPNATITTTITGGKALFNYTVTNSVSVVVASATGITGPTFTYSPAVAGTYTIQITDANTCTTTTSATVTAITTPTVTATPTQVSCFGGTNGSVTLTGSGGSGGYFYSFNGSAFTTTATYTGLSANTPYSYQVRDSNSCVSAIGSVTLTEPTAVSFTVVAPPFSCNTTTNASQSTTITVSTGGGTGTYSYSYDNGVTFGTNATRVVNDNGTTQTFNIIVRDANGCVSPMQAVVLAPLNKPTNLSFTNPPITCIPAATTTTVEVTATNGVGSLTFIITGTTSATNPSFFGPVTTTGSAQPASFPNLLPGNYTFRVTDANGCFYTESHNIAPVTPIAVSAVKLSDVACFGDNTGSARFTVTGFSTSGNYTINVTSSPASLPFTLSPTGDVRTLTDLVTGTYTFTVTDITTGCIDSESITIIQPTAALDIVVSSNINANCNVPTARVTVAASDGTPAYAYAFVPTGNTPAVGDYTSSSVRNLNPVTPVWDVYVRDANGCTDFVTVSITTDPLPTVTASGNGCLGTPGGYTITASNTTLPLSGIINPITYSINNGASYQTSPMFTVTSAGNYTIMMKDGNGCIATAAVVTVNPQLTLTAVLNKDITCSLPTAAQITLTPVGGSGTYTYEYKEAAGVYTTMASNVFNTSTPGSYTFRVTDAILCQAVTTTAIVLTAPINPDITGITQTAFINCNGDDTGAISIAIDNTKGQSPFVFNVKQFSDPAFTILVQDFGTQTSGLPAGYYVITVTDAKGCSDFETITISEPSPITFDLTKIDITCNAATGSSLGSITVSNVLGGTGSTIAPFKYFITNNFGDVIAGNPYTAVVTGREDHTFTIINFGVYTVNVVDANGCSFSKQITMASPPSDLDINVTTVSSNCTNGGTAVVQAISLVGSGNYEFGIVEFNFAPYTTNYFPSDVGFPDTKTFINLTPGVTYTFVVHDLTTNCYFVKTADTPILAASPLTSVVTPKNVTCLGNNDGKVTFTIDNFDSTTTSIDYQIFTAFSNVALGAAVNLPVTFGVPATVTDFAPLAGTLTPGSYYIQFIENGSGSFNGCKSASAIFEIRESSIDLSVVASLIKNSNCTDLGIITAQAQNGTGPYTYQVVPTGTPAIATDWVGTNTFTRPGSLGGIIYDVYAKDAYDCIKFDTVTVLADAPPTISAPAPICYDGTPFTIDLVIDASASATILPATYSVNGSAFQSSPSFTFNASGTYNLVIKDGNGCTATVPYDVYPQLVSSAAVAKPLDCTATPNAIITLTTIGGNPLPAPTYTYEVSYNGGTNVAATNPYTATAAGTYVFTITDVNNTTVCQATATIVLDPIPATVIAMPIVTNVSCNGGNDGTITINVTSGVGPYEYSLFDGVTATAFTTNNTFTGLVAGTAYVVTVRNDRDCLQASTPITVSEPTLLAATAAAASNSTCSNTTVITVTASQGTPSTVGTGYTYSFNSLAFTSANTFTVNNGPVDIITTISVKDANGCTIALPNVITPALTPPTNLSFVVTTAPTCPTNTATVQVTATSGLGSLDFDIIEFNNVATTAYATVTTAGSGSPASFANLPPGDYTFRVTDDNGCTYQELFTVVPVIPIAIVGALVNDITCNPANGPSNNGSANFTVTGFSSTGNYSINVTSVPAALPFTQTASGDVITFTGLSAGTYTVTVTDNSTLCTASDDITITEPAAIAFATAATKVFCSQDISQITVSGVTGGTGAYTYAVVAGSATAPLAGAYGNNPVLSVDTNLINLSWDVYVKDANGCIAMQNVTVVSDAPPTIVAPAAQCYTGTPFTVDLSPITITTTYNNVKEYTLNGSVLPSSTATFNGPGIFTIGVRDDNGCEATTTYTIEKQLLANAVLTKDLYCATPVNAIINVTITDGVAPYSYQMFNGATPVGGITPFVGNTFTVNPTIAGTYSFVITDSNAAACTVTSNDVEVTTPVNPSATFIQTNITCIGQTDGTITITPSNGVTPYTFTLTGIGANTSGDVTGIYSGLPAGSYNFVVTDAKNCTFNDNVTISNPAPLTATATVTPFGCDTANAPLDAVVTIVPSGGTGVYSYSINGGTTYQTSSSFTVNTAQTVNYIVVDANGCTITGSENVLPYSPPTDMDLVASPIYCSTIPVVATVTVNTLTGGVGPFVFEIISPAAAVTAPSAPSSTPFSFTNLAPDTYIIKVTDANGCSTTKAILVEEADKIAVNAVLVNNVFCNGDSTGAVNFLVSNYITSGNYTFSLSPAIGTMSQNGDEVSYTGLPAGNYTFNVNDTVSGCTASVINFLITEPGLPLSSTSVATNINCNNDVATVTITASGGTAPYRYAIARTSDPIPSVFGTSEILVVDTNNGVDISWIVYVKDANDCEINNPQPIVADANPFIALVDATQCPSSTGTYTITVTATGFSAALQYSADGSNYQTGNVITVNTPGIYTISVKDANGCITTATPVTIVDPLILTPTVTTSPSCTDGDGVIAVATTGGSGNYEYKIDSGVYPMATPFTGIASGTHTIYVRDTTTGCEVTTTIALQPATLITGFSLNTTPVTCNGGTDGTITASLATPAPGINDNPVYTYTLNGTTVGGIAVSRPSQNSQLFSGLAAGTYTVVVTSGRACTATQTIDVVEPAVIVVPAPTVVQFGCTTGNTGNLATITVTGVTGGTTPYLNYEFIKIGTPNTQVQFSASTIYNEANVLGGSYLVNVYDSKGCIGTTTAPITIVPYVALDKVNVVVDQAITCSNLENITITVTTVGGTAPNLEYTLVDTNATTNTTGTLYPSQTNTTGIFTNLPVADYLITVRNLDTNCEIKEVHYVNNPNTFELVVNATTDITCLNDTNGTATITLVDRLITTTPANGDNSGPFTYTLQDALGNSVGGGTASTAGPITITGLAAGTYTVTATLSQSPDCTVATNFTIGAPATALDISETHTEITCVTGNNDGSISVAATGGWPGGYQFELVGPTAAQSVAYSAQTVFTGLTAGSYTVNVRDSRGCVNSENVVLNNPTPIAFVAVSSTMLVDCINDTSASITVTTGPTGGSGNYLYTLIRTDAGGVVTTNGPQVTNTFTNLGAGTYQVRVSDSWTCSTTSTDIVINEPTRVTAALSLAAAKTCDIDARITLTAAGGTAPYSYSSTLNFASAIVMVGNTATFSVPVGTYSYYIRDNKGCVSFISNDVKIDEVPTLTIELDVQNAVINCRGDNSGVIVALAQGGLGNYVYTLLDSAGNPLTFVPTQSTPGNFTNLPGGSYVVRVLSNDCDAQTSNVVVIDEPLLALTQSVVVTDITCAGERDGTITITASGGTGVIQYAISPRLDQFFDTNVFENLRPGIYTYIVQDQNGCYPSTNPVEIREPVSVFTSVVPNSAFPEICAGDADGAFSVDITGGIKPYSVSLNDKNGTYTTGTLTQSQFDFSGLSGNEQIVYIRDANGCNSEFSILLGEPVRLNPTAVATYDCVNNTQANRVVVSYDSSNDPTDLDFDLDGLGNYQASNTFDNVAPGQHFITVRHTNGCIQRTQTFTVDQVDPLVLVIADGDLNQIKATATGGSGVYEYSYNGEDFTSQSTYAIYQSGNYTVIVRDKYGCTATANRDFTYVDICIPNYFTPNGDGNLDEWAPGCTNNYPDLSFSIFDRYGRVIAKYRIGQKWDGKYNGEELPSGDYWYTLKLNNNKDDREFVGHFTLYR